MSVTPELRRRVRADQSQPRFDPCLPRSAERPPAGPLWIHEIKHDGFRILAHRRGHSVRSLTRTITTSPTDSRWSRRLSLLSRSAPVCRRRGIVCDDDGLAVFNLMRPRRQWARDAYVLFDLLEVNGEDLRREPIEDRKRRLAELLRLPHEGIALNEHFGGDGAVIYKHACALGCEGIVSKRLGSPYRAGRSAHWLMIKNPAAAAVRRLEEEDWNG